jgi:DNA polymerase-3 subunit beta
MRFICDKGLLLKEVSIAQEIIASRNALSILSNVLLDASGSNLTIKATDLKVGFETTIPVQIDEEGSTTVFCDKFLGILRSLPEGDVTFEEKENNRLKIIPAEKKIDFQLKSISSDKFPEVLNLEGQNFFELPQAAFLDMVNQTIFAVSDDETRYFMNGVYFERKDDKLIMVATDGRRLSYAEKPLTDNVGEFSGIIIPTKILQLVRKLASGQGNLALSISEKNIFVQFDNQKISSNLIEGNFPNYNRVIPESQEQTAVLDKGTFVEALKRVSILAEQKSRRIYITLQTGNLVINSEENEIGAAKEQIACNYEGPEMTLALNYGFLLDPLKVVDEKEVLIEFSEPGRQSPWDPSPRRITFTSLCPCKWSRCLSKAPSLISFETSKAVESPWMPGRFFLWGLMVRAKPIFWRGFTGFVTHRVSGQNRKKKFPKWEKKILVSWPNSLPLGKNFPSKSNGRMGVKGFSSMACR